jgi:hypothetical protein
LATVLRCGKDTSDAGLPIFFAARSLSRRTIFSAKPPVKIFLLAPRMAQMCRDQ